MDINDYIAAATATNTRRAYRSGVSHFECEWGGLLPATADSVARYLAYYADKLTLNTLRSRLAALAQWHQAQGFADPTKGPYIRKVLKGIRITHPAPPKQAKPLQLEVLTQIVNQLDLEAAAARSQEFHATRLTALRNKAVLLIGFWGALRSDELSQMFIENIDAASGHGMTIRIPVTKTERGGQGAVYRVPALSRLCPVEAYLTWIIAAGLIAGPVFRRIDRWGHIADSRLNPGSISPLLRKMLCNANVGAIDAYSAHSLRRGFATWASENGWDLAALMAYVGWRDATSALRYIDAVNASAQLRIEQALSRSSE